MRAPRRGRLSGKKASKSTKTAKKAPLKKNNFKKAVLKVIQERTEDKQAYFTTGDNLTIFNSNITAVGDMLQIIPNVTNSTEDNGRIGQQLTAKNLNIRGHMKLNVNDVSDSTRLPSVIVRMMVLSMKTAGSYTQAQGQAPNFSALLKKGGSNTAFEGRLSDVYCPINTDLFTVHHDKKFYLNQSYINAIGASPPSITIAQDIKNTVKFFNFNVKCKNKVLKYDSSQGGDLLPTNWGCFMAIGYCYLDGSSSDGSVFHPTAANLGLHYTTTLNYEDN